jgi:hypothetical protein
LLIKLQNMGHPKSDGRGEGDGSSKPRVIT